MAPVRLTDLASGAALAITAAMDTAIARTADSVDAEVMDTAMGDTADSEVLDTAMVDTVDMGTEVAIGSSSSGCAMTPNPALRKDGWREEEGIREQGAEVGVPGELLSRAPQEHPRPRNVRVAQRRPEGRLEALRALRHDPPAGELSPGRVVIRAT